MLNKLFPIRCPQWRSYRLPGILLPLALTLSACETTEPPGPATIATPPAQQKTVVPGNSAEASKQAILSDVVALQDRLYRVAAPILVNNAPLCRKKTASLIGFTAKNEYSYSQEFTNTAHAILGLDERLQVMGVMAGSGAAKVGVQIGDKLVAINDIPVPQGENAEHQASVVIGPQLSEHSAFKLTVNRGGGADQSFQVWLTRACAFRIELGNSDSVNAYADDHRVMVTKGMMKWAQTDTQLAIVLATEMAHNALGHAGKLHNSAPVGAIMDNLAHMSPAADSTNPAPKPSTQDLDVAADRLGLYMAARAGYEVDEAKTLWTALAIQYPPTAPGSYTASHPVGTYRLSVINRVIGEIKSKQSAKKPLTP